MPKKKSRALANAQKKRTATKKAAEGSKAPDALELRTQPHDDLAWESLNPSIEERTGWDEGGFVGCEVLSGKSYSVDKTDSGAVVLRPKKRSSSSSSAKKSSTKNEEPKSGSKKQPSGKADVTSTRGKPDKHGAKSKRKSRRSSSSRALEADDGWDADNEPDGWDGGEKGALDAPPDSFEQFPDADVETDQAELPWRKIQPSLQERTAWDEGGFVGCEVLSGKDHVVERLADGNSFRITTTSGRKVLKGKTRIEEKNGKNTSEGGAEKKEKKEKKDKKKKKKEKKEKRVIDSKIAAAVTAELKARSEGAKPTAYKALRDKITLMLKRALDNAERQYIAEGLRGPQDIEAAKAKRKLAKKEAKLAAAREKRKANVDRAAEAAAAARPNADAIEVSQLSQGWTALALHPVILRNLARLGFVRPTPIQSMCIPAAISHRQDVVGAAQTGSGKTLAFGIPIVHALLSLYSEKQEQRRSSLITTRKQSGKKSSAKAPRKRARKDRTGADVAGAAGFSDDADDEAGDTTAASESEIDGPGSLVVADADRTGLFALIVSPTRELSMQIKAHIAEILFGTPANCVAIVGGMSKQKQQRLLRRRPEIVVGTPGRLWDLFAHNEAHFVNMHATLKFMVLDEFDRMVTPGAYPELAQLCKAVYSDKALVATADGAAVFPGAPVFDDAGVIVGREGEEKETISDDNNGESTVEETADPVDSADSANDALEKQTFLFSATLNIDLEGREKVWNRGKKNGNPNAPLTAKAMKRKKRKALAMGETEKEAAALGQKLSILEHIPRVGISIRAKPAIFDLSKAPPGQALASGANADGAATDQPTAADDDTLTLPSTLSIQQVSCPDDQKVAFLHFFLDAHRSGRTLIFVNSITLVKQLTQLLSLLRVQAVPLHASMQQRQRLKNLDRLRRNPDCVMVATDVAARGLDVPRVEHVIHYHVPRSAEIFVHRSGRTARAEASGHCLVLVAPHEQKLYSRICGVLGYANGFMGMPLELTRMSHHFSRAALANKIGQLSLEADRTQSEVSWYERTAAEMDIDLDDAMLLQLRKGKDFEHDPGSAEQVQRRKRKQLASMRARLKALLDEGERSKAETEQTNDKLEAAGATANLGAGGVLSVAAALPK